MKMSDYFKGFVTNKLKKDLTNFQGIRSRKLPKNVAARIHFPIGFGVQKPYQLQINKQSWKMLDVRQKKALLRHEALHIRFPRHDKMFMLYANTFNAPRFANDLIGAKYKIYGKTKDGRTEILSEYPDYESAKIGYRFFINHERKSGTSRFVRIGITNR